MTQGTVLQNAKASAITSTDSQHDLLSLPKKRRFQIGRWLVLLFAVYVTAVVVDLFLFNDSWNWPLVGEYLFSPRILVGVYNTLWLTVLALTCGLAFGLVVCAARLSRIKTLQYLAMAYIWVVRATPPLVMMLVVYFLAVLTPTLGLGLPFSEKIIEWPTNSIISPFSAAVIALSIYVGGKAAEIFRGSYLGVGTGQHEAAKVLGLSPSVKLVRVTGPQAVRIMIPPLANEVVTMFKNTSLVSIIGFAELLTTTQRIYAVNQETIPMLTVACIWYLFLTSILMLWQMWLERRFGRGFDRRAAKPSDEEAEDRAAIPVTNAVPLTQDMMKKGGIR